MSQTDGDDLDFDAEVRKLIDARPFRAFTIVLTSGVRYAVEDPVEFVHSRSVCLFCPRQGGIALFPPYHISSVESAELE